ncbi:MAG: hypothetical protein NT062_38035 [Proteobacteria bacterium]|nr:hypothetical protein [Pseudomonadota bacterium]
MRTVMMNRTLLALSLASSLTTACADPATPMLDDPAPDAGPDLTPSPDAAPPPVAGSLDPTFGTAGVRTIDGEVGYAAELAVQGDKLLACVSNIDGAHWVAHVLRFDASGAVDSTFGTDGKLTLAVAGQNVACTSLVADTLGRVYVAYREAGSGITHVATRGVDGEASTEVVSPAQQSGLSEVTIETMYGPSTGVAVGIVYPSKQNAFFIGGSTDRGTSGPLAGSPCRILSIDGRFRDVGEFGTPSTWQVLADDGNNLIPLGDSARGAAGTATPDLMHDAVVLPDHSIFAVGGMDNDTEVMVARFVEGATPYVVAANHQHGGPSTGRAVVLDGADRPIVVGAATAAGKTAFGWQRFAATSVMLDAAYQKAGLAEVAAPSGNGELVDVVRLGGAIYALGHYDLETTTPRLALVKIVE